MRIEYTPEAFSHLDSFERLSAVPVGGLLKVLRPRQGMRVLDVGSGTGTFFFPVFEALKGKGVFLAAELEEEMLVRFFDRLEDYVQHPGFSNIEVLRSKPRRLPLPDVSVDMVMMIHVYHELEDRPTYLKEVRRVMSPGGKLCLLDARPLPPEIREHPHRGAPNYKRVSQQQAWVELQEAGFKMAVSHNEFEGNWCLTVIK